MLVSEEWKCDILAEYTLEITQFCPHRCEYCSTNANKEGKYLEYYVIEDFINEFHILSSDRINISGGEPLTHPQFWNILQLCKSITKDVWVYTNAFDKIRYNTDVIPEVIVEANVCLVPGKYVYIPKNIDKVHILQLVSQGRAKNINPVDIHVSGNLKDKEDCKKCDHKILQANGKVVNGPCKKNYE